MSKKAYKKFIDTEIKVMVDLLTKGKKPLDLNKPFILYHGTSLSNLKKIKKEGLKPRGKKKSNWEKIGISRKDLVYLTDCYAMYYAFHSINKKNDKAIILKIKVDPKKIKLYLDEEFIYHLLDYNNADNHTQAVSLYKSINPKNLNKVIQNSLKKIPTWEDSLNFMGTVSCDGVAVSDIVGYSVIDERKALLCDPSISPMNYKICSELYKRDLRALKYKKLV